MADVQLEYGHVRIANALYEAIIYAPFAGTQMKIVHCLVRMTYGWNQLSARVGRAELASRCHVAFTGGFERQFDELIREGVVRQVARGQGRLPNAYALNKDFEDWGKFSVAAKALDRIYGERPDLPISHPPQGATTNEGEVPPTGGNTEASHPPQGVRGTPHRGYQTEAKSVEIAKVEAPKDIESQLATTPRARPTDEDASRYAVGLTTAANNAIAEKWGEATRTRPLRWDQATQIAVELLIRGVDLELARTAIVDCIRASKLPRPPRAMNYFSDAIDDAAKNAEQRILDAEFPLARRKGAKPERVVNVVSAEANAEKAKLEQLYDRERAAAASAWGRDPTNAAQYRAIVADANQTFSAIIETKIGERGRNSEIILACAKACGFPPFVAWLRSREPAAAGVSP